MKKFISVFLVEALCLSIAIMPVNVQAISQEKYLWQYKIISDENGNDTVWLENYYGNEENIVIPTELDGMNVSGFSSIIFFYNKNSMTSKTLTIPKSFDKFYTKYGLNMEGMGFEEVSYPQMSKATHFYDSPNLKRITFGGESESFTFDEECFKNCPNLVDIVFPDGCREVCFLKNSFKDCSSLNTFPVPETCTKVQIGISAFENCISLSELNFTDKTEELTIGKFAFRNSGISNITIDSGCEIKESAFENTKVTALKTAKNWKIETAAFKNCDSLETVELNDSTIDSYAFRNCDNLKEVTINNNTIADHLAFLDCESLENVNFNGENITTYHPFRDNPNLYKINGIQAFDENTGELNPEVSDLVKKHFSGADNVGFLNDFVQAQVKKVVSENITDDMSDVQKIKILHDWVCSKTEYDLETTGDRSNHNDASVFLGSKSVCDGYTRALNLLLNEAGIETYSVLSFDHMWNIVKLGDMYFHVDATWDDGDEISYNWFLKSDAELNKEGGSHSDWCGFIPSPLHSFQKSGTPKCEFTIGDTDMDGELSVNDAVQILAYVSNSEKYPLDENAQILSDTYCIGDGVNNMDALEIQKKLANVI